MPTAKVIILSEILRGQTYELTKDIYTIGRTDDKDICIPDGSVSSHHCDLVKLGDDRYAARDTGSTNGTRINGSRVTEQELNNSDILQIGGIEILFDCEDKSSTATINTQTGIDLTADAGLDMDSLQNVSPFQSTTSISSGEGTSKGFILMIAVFAIVVIALLVLLITKVFA